jgi:hypothetical protein
VIHTLELGLVDRTHFIAMEFVNGESAGALLARTRPTFAFCARIVADAAAGLHAAHTLRDSDGEPLHVVHRDVSPQNILISYDGAVKVTDFGVARAHGRLQITKAGAVKGKYAYMAPEQITSTKSVDFRADIFALGIVLFEMTTGKRLFKGDTDVEVAGAVMNSSIPRPSEVDSEFPGDLDRVVMRALERDPERRFQSVLDLQEALERFIMASGDPVMPAHVGRMMSMVFADRADQKKELIRKCEQGEPIDGETLDIANSPYSEIETSFPAARRRRLWLWIGGLGLLAGVVALVLLWLIPGPDAGTASTGSREDARGVRDAASSPAEKVTISVHATPESATITFAGEAVDNPFQRSQAPEKTEARVVVSAPGHVTQQISVPLDRSGRWSVVLERRRGLASSSKKKKRRRARRGRGRHKRKKRRGSGEIDDETVLDNPYQ